MSYKYDCFISHASEDKKEFVEPLANELRRYGINVWYDKFSLSIEDSLSRSIDEGLSKSRYGVLVLSKSFIEKPWPEYELRGLTAREIGSEKVMLPIWHNIEREEVLAFSPTLADKFAINSLSADLNYISRELVKIIRPDISDKLHRIDAFNDLIDSSPKEKIQFSNLKIDTTLRHEMLTPEQVVRIRLARDVLKEVYDKPLDETLLDFKRDINLNSEILVWEAIAAAYGIYQSLINPKKVSEKKEVLKGFLLFSMGSSEDFINSKHEFLNNNKIELMYEIWGNLGTEQDFKL